MDLSRVLCFPPGQASLDNIIKRENLTASQKQKLNERLDYFVNNIGSFKHTDVEEFNRINDLYVIFKHGKDFYDISLKSDGKEVFFESAYWFFDNSNYDSDDEDDRKLSSYIFRTYNKRLYPQSVNGRKVLTLDMYFNFVRECLNEEVPYFQKRR